MRCGCRGALIRCASHQKIGDEETAARHTYQHHQAAKKLHRSSRSFSLGAYRVRLVNIEIAAASVVDLAIRECVTLIVSCAPLALLGLLCVRAAYRQVKSVSIEFNCYPRFKIANTVGNSHTSHISSCAVTRPSAKVLFYCSNGLFSNCALLVERSHRVKANRTSAPRNVFHIDVDGRSTS